ncbi:response regulator receiver protein [[Synechococcus] sp. NIES-970]|uniref:response regulator n=1 Tax=Picosynechococcus sp. NKBG15041c TaxID=1407650 RepID=UPI000429038F|nr:response regulator [Picosynechococcus sp. NKBG15041c]BAW97711.1 response regulator receiver protein [[Synechococcus] sp. NIES-970]
MSTVLVVDDIQSELQLISTYLIQGGHQVIGAGSGEEALQKVAEKIPDVIVTDLVMPDMSGLELCRKLKKNPETAKIPVIACTTKSRQVDQEWAKRQGISVYLVKPCDQQQLLDAVASVVLLMA